jgi:hypothetical protein
MGGMRRLFQTVEDSAENGLAKETGWKQTEIT